MIVPDLTFVASANPIRYVGATPVLADVSRQSYTLDPACLEELVTERTRAIVAVHLYGHPVDMDPVLELAAARGLFVVEDATEALGSLYKGRPCGTLGDVGCFSFNGNKVITTGGGGMLLARDPGRLAHMRLLTLQGRVPGSREYLHSEVGFNYAMSNLQGALGLAQLERLEQLLEARREIAGRYERALAGVEGLTWVGEQPSASSNFWPSTILVDPSATARTATRSPSGSGPQRLTRGRSSCRCPCRLPIAGVPRCRRGPAPTCTRSGCACRARPA